MNNLKKSVAEPIIKFSATREINEYKGKWQMHQLESHKLPRPSSLSPWKCGVLWILMVLLSIGQDYKEQIRKKRFGKNLKAT